MSFQVRELRAALHNPWPSVRTSAAKALGRLGPAAKDAAPDLRRCLADPSSDVRTAAAMALGFFGPVAKDAIADLQQTAQTDIDPKVREAAAAALKILKQ